MFVIQHIIEDAKFLNVNRGTLSDESEKDQCEMSIQDRTQGDASVMLSSTSHVRSSSTSLITDATASILNNEDELKKAQIYRDLCDYETVLGQLIKSVDNFRPDVSIAERLINVDKRLFESLGLFSEYDKIDSELKRLDRESDELQSRTKEILETLNDCYNKLNRLPMLEQVNMEKSTILKQRSKINSSVLLEYATKLSKFTKIPPTFDKGTIGPNNFIWPAEDALRRGMLAVASLHAKELTNVPGETNEETENVKDLNPASGESVPGDEITPGHEIQGEEQENQQKPQQTERRQSYVFTGNDEGQQDKSDDAIDLDLDLFNADDF